MGEIKKVAGCKVKPYDLVERDQGYKGGEDNDQGEKDIENYDLECNNENDYRSSV